MTEAEWLACDNPTVLGRFIGASGGFVGKPANTRKVRLFAVACCRQIWHMIAAFPAIARCVEFAEGYADRVGAKKRLKKLRDDTVKCMSGTGVSPAKTFRSRALPQSRGTHVSPKQTRF